MKKVIWIGVIGIVVLAGLLLFALGNLGAIVERAVEGVGSAATGTAVTLDKADVSLGSGEASLRGLEVANPEGFSKNAAIRLGEIKVVIDTASVGKSPLVIKEVLIDGPQVRYEVGTSGSNVGKIQEAVERFAGGGSKAPDASGGGDAASGGGTKFIIEKLTIRGGEAAVAATFLGDRKVSAKIPETTLRDIGKSGGGATSGEVASKVLSTILSSATGAVDGLNLDGLKKGAAGILEGAGKAVKDLFGK